LQTTEQSISSISAQLEVDNQGRYLVVQRQLGHYNGDDKALKVFVRINTLM
jgi:hypothetical protein